MSSRRADSVLIVLLSHLILTPAASSSEGPIGEHDATIARIAAEISPTFVIEGEAPRLASLEQRMSELGVPGVSVAVIREGEIAWARAWGYADLEGQRSLTPRTRFQAASISKPVAAMAALRQVDDGWLELDADVNEVLYSWQVPAHGFAEADAPAVVEPHRRSQRRFGRGLRRRSRAAFGGAGTGR